MADIAPNMTNLSIYGRVVSVSVTGEPLPAVLRSRQQPAGGQSQSCLSQHMSQPLLLLPVAAAAPGRGAVRGVQVVELGIRDASGETRLLCCGREAVADALTCR